MSGLIFTDANFQAIGNDGLVVPYGKLYIYDTATGLYSSTFQDSELTIENTNPVILSATGKARVFLPYGKFNISLYDQYNSIVWTLNNFISSVLDNQSILDAAAATALNASIAQESAVIATEQASQSLSNSSIAQSSAIVASAYANINWAGFSLSDGELVVTYADALTSIPSLVDGEFIITY